MPDRKPDGFYRGIARRYLRGETLAEIAESISRSPRRVRTYVTHGVAKIVRRYHDGYGYTLRELEGMPYYPGLEYIDRFRDPLLKLLEGDELHSTVLEKFKYRSLEGYLDWPPTFEALNELGENGWEIVTVFRSNRSERPPASNHLGGGRYRQRREKVIIWLKKRRDDTDADWGPDDAASERMSD